RVDAIRTCFPLASPGGGDDHHPPTGLEGDPRAMSRRFAYLALLAILAGTASGIAGAHPRAGRADCAQQRVTSSYSAAVARALRAGRDLWGNRLLHAPGGPTYERMEGLLKPLLLAG